MRIRECQHCLLAAGSIAIPARSTGVFPFAVGPPTWAARARRDTVENHPPKCPLSKPSDPARGCALRVCTAEPLRRSPGSEQAAAHSHRLSRHGQLDSIQPQQERARCTAKKCAVGPLEALALFARHDVGSENTDRLSLAYMPFSTMLGSGKAERALDTHATRTELTPP